MRILLSIMLLTGIALSAPLVVYDQDDRKDIIAVSARYQEFAKSIAAQFNKNLVVKKATHYKIKRKKTLGFDYNLTKESQFYKQKIGAYCSSFLISDNIIATAGHCVEVESDCKDFYWVFNYQVDTTGKYPGKAKKSDVVTCKRIIKTKLTGELDFALIEINERQDRPFLKLQEYSEVGDKVFMLGFPSGLPMKLANNAHITDIESINNMAATLDAFSVNSGSAVISEKTGSVVGILVRGTSDYKEADKYTSKSIVNVCDTTVGVCADGGTTKGEGIARTSQLIDFIP